MNNGLLFCGSQEKLQACLVLYMEELESTDAGDVLYEGL